MFQVHLSLVYYESVVEHRNVRRTYQVRHSQVFWAFAGYANRGVQNTKRIQMTKKGTSD